MIINRRINEMIYLYNRSIGLVPCTTRKEALQKLADNNITQPVEHNILAQYKEYQQAYEAIILYIIKKANEKYPEYLTKKKIGELFTLVMLRWYTVYQTSYTQEKPIRAGHIKKYKMNIGFSKFEDYYDNIKRLLQGRYNDEKYYVIWTELETNTIKQLVDNKDMIRIIDKSIIDGQYSKNAQRTIKRLYKKLPPQYKVKKQ